MDQECLFSRAIKSYKLLLSIEMIMFIESLPNKRLNVQRDLLSKFMDKTKELLEPAIAYVAGEKEFETTYLKMFTALHNQILFYGTLICDKKFINTWANTRNYACIIMRCLKMNMPKCIVQITLQNRISGYVTDKYIDCRDSLYFN